MLEIMVDNRVIYVVTGGVTVLGVISKIVSNLSLKRMVKAAGNMSKSNHALMRLVRAKFEHACMVSEKVENVPVFVDKYLYEYKTLGLKLHTWQRLQKICVSLCLALGVIGAFLEYLVHGMNDEVIKTAAYGGILGILLYLFHLTSDEGYRLDAARNYMVDYLENVCLHKYEKLRQKEGKEEPMRPDPAKEVPTTLPNPEIKPPAMPEPYEVPDVKSPIRAFASGERGAENYADEERNLREEKHLQKEAVREAAKDTLREAYKKEEKKEEKKQDKDILIRQILEEFMA